MIRKRTWSEIWYQPSCDRCYRYASAEHFDLQSDARAWVCDSDQSGEALKGWGVSMNGTVLICPDCIEPAEKELLS